MMVDMDDEDDFDDFPDETEGDGYDKRLGARGTIECDGLCDPMCDWCLVGHICPDECHGGPCPYDAIAAEAAAV